MADSSLAEFMPNPNEVISPSNDWEAMEDAVRYLAFISTRQKAIDALEDGSRIVMAVQGFNAVPPLNPAELHIAGTIEYCIGRGLLRHPVTAVALLEGVRQEALDGGVFIGQPRTAAAK
jgi:hypothetical protein